MKENNLPTGTETQTPGDIAREPSTHEAILDEPPVAETPAVVAEPLFGSLDLTPEQKHAMVHSLKGAFAQSGVTVEDFLASKRAKIAKESQTQEERS